MSSPLANVSCAPDTTASATVSGRNGIPNCGKFPYKPSAVAAGVLKLEGLVPLLSCSRLGFRVYGLGPKARSGLPMDDWFDSVPGRPPGSVPKGPCTEELDAWDFGSGTDFR